MEYSELNFKEDLLFISSYVAMEESSLSKVKTFLKEILPAKKIEHLYSSWVGRYDKDNKIGQFGSFFINIEHKTQALFLMSWGIDIPNYKEYLEELESTPIAYFTATPPLLTERLNYLLVFFLNHGINDIEGYSLVDLPKERYGNSYNWGSYILSLNPIEQFKLLSHLSLYCHEQIDKSSKNREQLKRAKLKTT
jgi:hypothetical protein